jgi:hypothetical protein
VFEVLRELDRSNPTSFELTIDRISAVQRRLETVYLNGHGVPTFGIMIAVPAHSQVPAL